MFKPWRASQVSESEGSRASEKPQYIHPADVPPPLSVDDQSIDDFSGDPKSVMANDGKLIENFETKSERG